MSLPRFEGGSPSPARSHLSFLSPRPVGRVALVGAGPGDPELLTLRGLRRLRRADTVIYDRLVHPSLLEEAPAEAKRIDVGKAPGRPGIGQKGIETLLVREAQRGAFVVRLKGGDPFVFGRGGEEVSACLAAGISCEVVPGVTSAVSAPGAAGIPLTHRGVAASFAVITGHLAGDRAPDWSSFAAVDTLVILMGVARLGEISRDLQRAGRRPSTPVALIERATCADQRVLHATLGDLPRRAAETGARSPATLVVGEVASLGLELAPWLSHFEGPPRRKPLRRALAVGA